MPTADRAALCSGYARLWAAVADRLLPAGLLALELRLCRCRPDGKALAVSTLETAGSGTAAVYQE
jgi:hypothetical protein